MNTQRQKVAHCEGCIWTTMPTQTRFLLTSETINGCRQFGTHSFAYKNPVCRTETDATMWASTKKCCFFFLFLVRGEEKAADFKIANKWRRRRMNKQSQASSTYKPKASGGERKCSDSFQTGNQRGGGSGATFSPVCLVRPPFTRTGKWVGCVVFHQTSGTKTNNHKCQKVTQLLEMDIFFLHVAV